MPASWPTGIVPYGRSTPYEQPAPPIHTDDAEVAFALNPRLVDWAYAVSRKVKLPDDANLEKLRAPYSGPGHEPPFVLEGEGLMSARTWYGAQLNDWAERWVAYWTGGKGQFAMSAEEDTGILQALTFLARAHRADLNRVLSLRAASDYTVGPPSVTAAEFLAKENKEGFPATPEALDSLYAAAAPVARALADNWATTRNTVPGGTP
jgi:purine nucleoside permease